MLATRKLNLAIADSAQGMPSRFLTPTLHAQNEKSSEFRHFSLDFEANVVIIPVLDRNTALTETVQKKCSTLFFRVDAL
jgi:hypothetical protein